MNAQQNRETSKTNKLKASLPALSLVAVFLALWYWWFLSPRYRHSAAARASSTNIFAAFESLPGSPSFEPPPQIYADRSSGRTVFPYSVVPGGIRSAQELADTAQNDPLVAQHYAGFRLHTAHMIRLKKDRQAYVSYRLGDQIFWTRHKVTLHAGETLLTDGKNMARGRCGNRVSISPKTPVSPREPADRTMSTPVFVLDPVPAGFPVGEPLARLTLPPQGFGPPSGSPGGPFPPFFPPIFPGGPGSPFKPSAAPPPPPIVSTPEPASGLLAVLGLVCLMAMSVLLRK